MKILQLLLLSIISLNCYAQSLEDAALNSGLILAPVPAGDSWYEANHSELEYCVSSTEGEVKITQGLENCNFDDLNLEFNGIQYIGSNRGEFGGDLSFINSEGEKEILINDNIVQLIPLESELLVFSGLAHLMSSDGAIYKVTHMNGAPSVERITLLPDAPRIILRHENADHFFTIISSSGLFTFDLAYESINALAIHQFWGGLYPNSAVIQDNKLLIGMRSGVVIVTISYPRIGELKYYQGQL